ncbi:MAG: hypothetical protein HY897_07585 [Deltaproteobacteria bacterium]|nr:hypothetical protein [Deltaproteobacteria bacterium]
MKKLTVFVMIPVVALTLAVYAASCHCGNPNPSPPPLASRGGESPPLLKQEGAGGVATHRSAILRDFSSESEMNRWNRGYGVTEDTSISAGATRRTLGLMNYGLTNARSGVDGWQLAHGTPLPFERFSHASVVVNGRLYVIGGCSASSCDPAEKDVRFATLMADGTIGGWSSANDLPANRRGHAAVAHHGRIYVTGGTIGPDGEFNTADTVFVATVNPDGTLGVWSETTKMLDKRYDHASVVYNDYLYVLGGFNYGGKLRAVDFAKIKPDGTLGAWTSTVILPTATRGHSAAAYEGFVYVVGGAGTEGVVLYAKINGDGTIGNWTSEAAVPGAGRVYHAGVAYNGHLYVTGGTNENYVTYIPINADGSLGTAWTQGTSIPNGRWQHSSVVHNGFLYVIGGTDATGIKSYIHFAPIRPDGSVGTTWVNASTLADDRYGHTVAIHNGFYYLVGGVVRGSYSNDVSFAPIKADGTLGAFTPTAQFATGRAFHSGAILNGYLYVFSGSGQSGTLDDVQFAQIKADGSLDPWVTTTSVPVGRAYSAAATHAGRLYVTGGLGAMSGSSGNSVGKPAEGHF